MMKLNRCDRKKVKERRKFALETFDSYADKYRSDATTVELMAYLKELVTSMPDVGVIGLGVCDWGRQTFPTSCYKESELPNRYDSLFDFNWRVDDDISGSALIYMRVSTQNNLNGKRATNLELKSGGFPDGWKYAGLNEIHKDLPPVGSFELTATIQYIYEYLTPFWERLYAYGEHYFTADNLPFD